MADPLVTLTALKAATGEHPDPTLPSPKDASYLSAIEGASALIRAYTGLRLELTTGIATARSFEYDGSGYLDIDECTAITGISQTAGYSWATPVELTTDTWSAQPYNEPVKRWLRLPEMNYGMSPEMGFKWNLDTVYDRYPARPNVLSITATWGWPEFPVDIQRAAIWTALALAESPKEYQQESISDYSRTRAQGVLNEPIPERAQIALAHYVIPRV